MRSVLLLIILLAAPAALQAQTSPDICTAPTGTSDTIFTGRPPSVAFTLAKQKPTSATDPTPVPNTVDGFTVLIGGVALPDFTAGSTPIAKPCPDNLNNGYIVKLPTGYQKGTYTLGIKAYVFTRDASGNPTTTKLESVVVNRPFVVVDPPMTNPLPPANVRVYIP